MTEYQEIQTTPGHSEDEQYDVSSMQKVNQILKAVTLRRRKEDHGLTNMIKGAGYHMEFHEVRAKIALHYDTEAPQPKKKREMNSWCLFEKQEKNKQGLEDEYLNGGNKKQKVDSKDMKEKYANFGAEEYKELDDDLKQIREDKRAEKVAKQIEDADEFAWWPRPTIQFDFIVLVRNPKTARINGVKYGDYLDKVDINVIKQKMTADIKGATFPKLTNKDTKRKSRDSNAVSHPACKKSNERVEVAKRRLLKILNHDLGTTHTNVNWISMVKIEDAVNKPHESFDKNTAVVVSGWEYGRLNTTNPFSKNFIKALETAIDSKLMELDGEDIFSHPSGECTIKFEHLATVETRQATANKE